MNFSSESVQLKSNSQNEDFYFDTETPRGHFFAVLDLASHDYANLNATLKVKLETIVSSFVSLSSFSADLFLGYLAKEINNFLQSLGEQSGGPELVSSAALCLLSGNRLSYFIGGEVRINVLSGDGLVPLNGEKPEGSTKARAKAESVEKPTVPSEPLGGGKLDAPMTDRVHSFTLEDDQAVLIMTPGLEEALGRRGMPKKLMSLRSSDPKLISETLMKAGASSSDGRTLFVITGPYDRYVDPALEDMSKAVASLEERISALTESDTRRESIVAHLEKQALHSETKLEQRLSQHVEMFKEALRGKADKDPSGETRLEERLSRQIEHLKEDLKGKADKDEGVKPKLDEKLGRQIELLKDDLEGKAAKIDLLELDEKIRNLSVVLAGKADTAEVLGLQRDVLKLGIVSNTGTSAGAGEMNEAARASDDPGTGTWASQQASLRSFMALKPALVILAIAIGGAFIGAWLQSLQSPTVARQQELWSVKTSGNQILISRLDEAREQGGVAINVAQPLSATGEQTFSSFADVKQYIDTITTSSPPDQVAQPTQSIPPKDSPAASGVTEIAIKNGDTLQRLAQRYNVPQERIMALNPNIKAWTRLHIGQKVVVPAAP